MARKYRTPPEVAELLGVAAGKVVNWLELGELKGSNLAARTSGRPRYRIADDDLADFLNRRSASVVPRTPERRSRPRAAVKKFI